MDHSNHAFALKLRAFQEASKTFGVLHTVQVCCGAVLLGVAGSIVITGLLGHRSGESSVFRHDVLLTVCAVAIVANGVMLRLMMKVLGAIVSVESAPKE